MGNPILGDDGVGIHVIRSLKSELKENSDLKIEEAATGGLNLVEMFLGYDKGILIDSIKTKDGQIGTIHRFNSDDFRGTDHASSFHIT